MTHLWGRWPDVRVCLVSVWWCRLYLPGVKFRISNFKFKTVETNRTNKRKWKKEKFRLSDELWYVQYSITLNRLQWFVDNGNLDQLHNLLFIAVLHANLPKFNFQLQFDFLFFPNWITCFHICDEIFTKLIFFNNIFS